MGVLFYPECMKRIFAVGVSVFLGLASDLASAKVAASPATWLLSSDFSVSRKPAKSVDATLVNISFKDDLIALSEFRQTYQHLSDKAFQEKLEGSLERDLMFFRSFVNTYYQDLAQNVSSSSLVLCLGDAHPENFGFMSISGQTVYVFNDLDDSGVCPIEFDILRYFASVELAFQDRGLLEKAALEYSQVLSGKKLARHLDSSLVPNLKKRREKILRRYTHAGAFKESEDYVLMSESEKKTWLTNLKDLPVFARVQLLDIVKIHRTTGGSGGLQRYWLLSQKDNVQEILELKEFHKAGTSYGTWEQPRWDATERLSKIKKSIWGQSPEFYDIASVGNTIFLVRSRTKDSLDLGELSKKELESVMLVQAGILAAHHKQFAKQGIAEVEKWILANAPRVVERYRKSLQQLKP